MVNGTIATVAQLAIERDLPLAVFPAGTLNHFARSLELETHADAARAATHGSAGSVDVGRIDGRVFLNTAGLGGYPEMRWLGRTTGVVASLFGTVERTRVFGSVQPTRLEIDCVSRPILTAHEGEVTGPVDRVVLEVDPKRLTVYR